MLVRVFVPKPLDPADGSDLDGTEHEFPALPCVGDLIRFTDHRAGEDFTVDRVGYIQDGDGFVACSWVKPRA
ncbi:MAG: hypothetical protein EON59_03205 [Alphaproteobacteria bacterium]|nr:MAG: hypothetical protein EON59_03205 [Alphaproteobacteria bacterium]